MIATVCSKWALRQAVGGYLGPLVLRSIFTFLVPMLTIGSTRSPVPGCSTEIARCHGATGWESLAPADLRAYRGRCRDPTKHSTVEKPWSATYMAICSATWLQRLFLGHQVAQSPIRALRWVASNNLLNLGGPILPHRVGDRRVATPTVEPATRIHAERCRLPPAACRSGMPCTTASLTLMQVRPPGNGRLFRVREFG